MYEIIGGVSVNGKLNRGCLFVELSPEEYEDFKNLTEDEQKAYLTEHGELEIYDFDVEEVGEIETIDVIDPEEDAGEGYVIDEEDLEDFEDSEEDDE